MKIFERDNIHLYCADFLKVSHLWEVPTVIVCDGPYGIGGFEGDPYSYRDLADWYLPHIEAFSKSSKPNTTLWFWNTEIGWATVHPILDALGWDFVNCHIWNKGKAHVAGNVNTATIRKLPVVTEVCVQYVKKPVFVQDGKCMSMQEWLRAEWGRTKLPFSKTNEVCGVKDAATRKYFTTSKKLWYYPPVDAFVKLVDYANSYGAPSGKPYFSLNGISPASADDWRNMRSKFTCPYGVTNVWTQPPLAGAERIKINGKTAHLNQKPLNLMELIIGVSSDVNDVVWEPFGGLCSATVAAQSMQRKCYAAEINNDVFELAQARLCNKSNMQSSK
ncbi:DNA methyltransferase [Alistipes communis]|uniref:DNA methyltransferase n=1 Tax=Alistipes communis TaxID=2585118 RepID=UPI00320A6950